MNTIGTAIIFAILCIPLWMLVAAVLRPSQPISTICILVVICVIQGVAFVVGRNNEEMLFFTLPIMGLCIVGSIIVAVFNGKKNSYR